MGRRRCCTASRHGNSGIRTTIASNAMAYRVIGRLVGHIDEDGRLRIPQINF